MNLFEATHILQSVGYNVKKQENTLVESACKLLESVIAQLPELNEMSQSRAAKADSAEAKELEKVMASMDSKKSRPGNGSMSQVDKYLAAYDALKAKEDELSAFDRQTLKNFENDGYKEACENDDITLLSKTEKGHGASSAKGGDFKSAFATGNVKRCLDVLVNRIRSGFATQEAKDATLAALQDVSEMEGAEAYASRITAAINKLSEMDLGGRRRVSGNTYVIEAGPKAKFVKAILMKNGIKGVEPDEDGVFTFATSPARGAAITAILEPKGIDVFEQEREVKNAKISKSYRILDLESDLETAEIVLDEIGAEVDPETGIFTLVGTDKQITKTIEQLIEYGVEPEEILD